MSKKIFCLALGAMLLALGFPAEAQQSKKVPRIGYLGLTGPTDTTEAFRQGLRDLGYVEEQNVAIEYRWAEGKYERLPDLAADLVRVKVDMIFAIGGTEPVQAAKNATRTIPIVFVIADDPVDVGLVTSLARPGGNITGFSSMNAELSAKRLELLKEAIPAVTRVAVLSNPVDPGTTAMLRATEAAGRALGVQLQSLEVRAPEEFDSAFVAATRNQAGALTVLGSPMFFRYQTRIAELSAKHRLPVISAWRQLPEAGGLMSYGVNISDMFRRAASYVDKILKGAKPADLPVERPTKFELIINLKTAKQIGLTIPPNVLARADRVIK